MPKHLWAALLLSSVRARPYIKIAEPLQDAVVYGEDDGTGQNIRGVRLVLHYYDLPDGGYDRLRVVTRVDRGYTNTLGPPLPDSTLTLSSRLGTHFLEIVLRDRDEPDGDFDDAATVTYDLVPAPGDDILPASRKIASPGAGTKSYVTVAASPKSPSGSSRSLNTISRKCVPSREERVSVLSGSGGPSVFV